VTLVKGHGPGFFLSADSETQYEFASPIQWRVRRTDSERPEKPAYGVISNTEPWVVLPSPPVVP
jgi:hypothetical protein